MCLWIDFEYQVEDSGLQRSALELGAVHILRQPPEGGVSQKLTIAYEGGRG